MKNTEIKKSIGLALTAALIITAAAPLGSTPARAADTGTAGQALTVSAGEYSAMIIKQDGSLWGWGAGAIRHSDGTAQDSDVPARLADFGEVTSVSHADSHTMAIKKDGSLWTWGSNEFGELGDGTTTERSVPTRVLKSGVAAVSVGRNYTAVIKTDGTLWTWGKNDCGQLGDGTYDDSAVPIKILDNIVAVSAGEHHTMAVGADGTLWGWGANKYGELGNSTTMPSRRPVRITDGVLTVSAGDSHTAIVRTDGSLWVCGGNIYGDYDDGTYININPIRVLDDAVSVSTGRGHTMAIKSDGSLWGWGRNYYGQIGDGTATSVRATPVKILDGVAAVSACADYTLAVKLDGTLLGWGYYLTRAVDPAEKSDVRSPRKVTTGIYVATIPTPGEITPDPTMPAVARPATAAVIVNGTPVAFDAYNIGDNNYFKLRDIAYTLRGTAKRFSVGWDKITDAITLSSGWPYVDIGGEMAGKGEGEKTAVPTTSRIFLDGVSVQLTAYNIGGNNYFKLRDIGQAFDFGVTWDAAAGAIIIDTNKGYTP
jgi:alpha-tubulin suppressor-like RCC1 family protein